MGADEVQRFGERVALAIAERGDVAESCGRVGDEPREAPPDPAVILEEMAAKLFEEGRKELFALLIKNLARVRAELAVIRERTVALQGYDTFKESVVAERAAEVMHEFVTPEMEARKKRLVDVALRMMISQGVVGRYDERGWEEARACFLDTFRRGRVKGFSAALELLYERR